MRKIFVIAVLACVTALATATGASAARQTGLVNINVEDNVVQVPVALAANICGVTVAALVADLHDNSQATCTALAESGATVTPREGKGGQTRQDGLINVNIEDNTVQIPIAAAVNVCDVDVFILASAILLNDATECTAGAGAAGIA